jgi:hypothetical protein
MKLVTFESSRAHHIGAVLADGRSIADFTASSPAPHFRDMLALIDGGAAALEEARALAASPQATVALSETRLLAPVPEPRQMRDFLVFEKHLRQARANEVQALYDYYVAYLHLIRTVGASPESFAKAQSLSSHKLEERKEAGKK